MCAKSMRKFEAASVAATLGRKTLSLTVVVLGAICLVPARPTTQERSSVLAHGPFYLRSYTGKCLTVDGLDVSTGDLESDPSARSQPTGSPVVMTACPEGPLPNAAVQEVVVEERNSRHQVTLRTGGKVIGVTANILVDGVPLELQDFNGSAGQMWELDGDSLILAANRDLVAEVKNGRTPSGTPVILGRRNLDDPEFWTLVAVDGTDRKPTNGFVRVPQEKDLGTAIAEASWGTVIEVDGAASLRLDDYPQRTLRDGVTLRGDRRGTRLGPELRQEPPADGTNPAGAGLTVGGSHVRITGMRVRGPSRSKAANYESTGIFVDDDEFMSAIVDHNELSDWTHAAVRVKDYDDYLPGDDEVCGTDTRPRTVRVARNFIHHNVKDGLGYGVSLYANGFATIDGNTFLYNRHAIAADGIRLTGYSAFVNLVLSAAPSYGFLGSHEQDFDMHGSDHSSDHTGGIAGSDVDITRNTFLGTNRRNYDLRGVPCALHLFDNNVSRESEGEAIHWYGEPYAVPPPPPPYWLEISNNHFGSPDPTRRLGVGDFDGDGRQDLFLATGTAWYYAPRGRTEWRYLNAQTSGLGSLLLGDFDGDGRTDVLIRRGTSWLVSWAGVSKPETINESTGATADFAVGDFDGNGRADILYTNSAQWLVSFNGTSPFTPYAFTSQRVADLRFGDFDGDGRTDAFAVINGYWMVRYGGTPTWAVLRPALSSSVDHLVVADFDGDGRADVATSSYSFSWTWKVSADGVGGWTTLRAADRSLDSAAAIGAFDGAPGLDVLQWSEGGSGQILDVISAGVDDPHHYSRDDMR